MTSKRELGSILGFQLSLMKLVEKTGLTVKPAVESNGVNVELASREEMEELVRRVMKGMGPTIQ